MFVKSYLHPANVLKDCANEIVQKLSRVVPLLLRAQLNASFPISEIFAKTFGCYLFSKAYECVDSVNGATYFNLGKWLQSPSVVILEPRKIKSDTVSTVSPSISHEVVGPDAMVFVF